MSLTIDLKAVSVDALITQVKLSSGALLVLDGFTMPEGLPFLVMAVVDKSGCGILDEAKAFQARLSELGSRKHGGLEDVSGWAKVHRAAEAAKRELGEHAPTLELLEHMMSALGKERGDAAF